MGNHLGLQKKLRYGCKWLENPRNLREGIIRYKSSQVVLLVRIWYISSAKIAYVDHSL